jgi:hypothetical protein
VTARASKISLIVFVVLLVLSAFLMSVDGDYWPWYAVMSVFAAVPLVVGPRRYRIMGTIALLISGALIVGDIAAGRRFHSPTSRNSTMTTRPPAGRAWAVRRTFQWRDAKDASIVGYLGMIAGLWDL